MKPKVSFVVSVYNAEKYLELFLKSIVKQSYQGFECILVDAASQDRTRAIIKKYQKKDPRLILVEKKFISIPRALNIGLKKAKGEYIARVDADNILFEDYLYEQVEYLENYKNVDFVIADELKIDSKNKIIGFIPFLIQDYAMKKHLLFKTAIGGAPMLGRKKAFFKVGLYEETTKITEDRIFALKAKEKCVFASLDSINYAYRLHAGAITRRLKKDKQHENKVAEYERKYIGNNEYINDLTEYSFLNTFQGNFKTLRVKKIANTIFYCGCKLFDEGRREAAAGEFRKAEKIYPANRALYRYFALLTSFYKGSLLEFSKKVDYWLPFKIDLMQLVPVRKINSADRKHWHQVEKKYSGWVKELERLAIEKI